MAGRRLAISSLLCADDSPSSPVAGPSHLSPAAASPSRHVTQSPSGYPQRREHPHRAESDPTRARGDVVPLSLQPALHLRRRTPSPSPPSQLSPPLPSPVARRSFKDIAFDNLQGLPAGATAPSASPSAVDLSDHNKRRYSSRVDSPFLTPTSTSPESVHSTRPHAHATAEGQYLAQHRPRSSSNEIAEQSRSPRHSTSSIHSLINPTSSYPPQHLVARPSKSDKRPSPPNHDVHSPVPPPPAPRPSVSPTASIRKASYPVTLSPTISTKSAVRQSPSVSSVPAQRPLSRHTIASLLTDSPPISRVSAASLPHILNSPSRSPVIATTPAVTQGVGMEGLEALVQAATQERRRLSGEISKDEAAAVARAASTSRHPSPVVERNGGSARVSPLLERAAIHAGQERSSPKPGSLTTLLRSPPLSSHIPAPPHPIEVHAVPLPESGKPRSHSPPFTEREGEPPLKKRRGSEAAVPLIPFTLQSREASHHSPTLPRTSQLSSLLQPHSPVPPTVGASLDDLNSTARNAEPPHVARSSPPLPPAQLEHPRPAEPAVEVKKEDVASNVDSLKAFLPDASSTSPRIHSPAPGRQSPSDKRKSPVVSRRSPDAPVDVQVKAEPVLVPAAPESKDAPRQHTVTQKKDEAGPPKKKKKAEGKDKVDKPAKVARREQAPQPVKTDRQPSVPTKELAQEDDPHDWLMEHVLSSGSSPRHDPAERRPTASADHSPPTRPPLAKHDRSSGSGPPVRPSLQSSKKSSKESRESRPALPARSPTPVAMLEEEIAAVPVDRHSRVDGKPTRGPTHGHDQGRTSHPTPADMDLDAELDFVAGPTDSDSKRKQDKTVDMDVEDELLSLLDDKPHHHRGSSHFHTRPDVPKLSTPLPSAPHSPEQASLQPSPTKVKHASNGVVMSERESMPPPQTPDPALDSSSKKGEASATASTKKKDGAAKSTAKKPAAAAKPKAPKASTVAKSNGKGSALAKDGSSTPVLSASNSALTVPAVGTESKVKKTSPHPAGTVTGAGVAAKRAVSTSVGGAASRSRSTSVMPTPHDADKATDKKVANEEPEEEAVVDDKLYCICKTKYDEDRVMIACDRCDEWYHTQCVNMPDLEVDLVDQFICPVCIANNPHLPLKTTYKRRCHTGLNHPHPSSPSACHKPARGAFSKYCSDDCAVRFMQSKIRRWGGDKAGLWEGVKDADRREAVVVRCVTDGQEEIDGGDTKPDINTPAKLSNGDASATRTEVVKPSKSKTQREADRLDSLLSRLPVRRSALKKEEELLLWRESVVDLAIARAEAVGECGWDQRLCFGEDEIAEFGAEVLQSYDSFKDGGDGDSMHVDGGDEWWCRGKKKCDRHAGWQKLRQMEAEVDRELLNASLDKITTEERELRSRIEDILKDSDSKPPSDHQSAQPGPGTTPLKPINGDGEVNGVNGVKTKTNGAGADSGAKKGKKKKAEGP